MALRASYGDANTDYQTDVLTRDYAVPFIQAQAAVPGPYFLWLSYHPPHFGVGRDDRAGRRCSLGPPDDRAGRQSAIPPARYARAFQPGAACRIRRRSTSATSPTSQSSVRRRPPLSASDLQLIRRDYRCGLAALSALDDGVAEIVATLEAVGELDDTVLVFITDQGVMAGEHRIKRGKNRPYEEALRIPLMMSGPADPRGRRRQRAGRQRRHRADAARPCRRDDARPARRPLDGIFARRRAGRHRRLAGRVVPIEGRERVGRSRHGFKVRSYVGVRTARYATSSTGARASTARGAGVVGAIGAGRTTDRELYDLQRDPYELKNRQRRREYRTIRARLARSRAGSSAARAPSAWSLRGLAPVRAPRAP